MLNGVGDVELRYVDGVIISVEGGNEHGDGGAAKGGG
jgi:hypothetical protein